MPPKGEAAASTAAAGARGKKGAAEVGMEPGSKRVKKREKRYKKVTANKDCSITLVKTVAQTMSRTRELEAVAYDVELFKKSSPALEAM